MSSLTSNSPASFGPLQEGTSRTRHIRVTNWIRQQIIDGYWKVGDRLPSYNEMRELHGVHTATMEKVYAQLESEGLIVRTRGSGTYVAQPVIRERRVAGLIGLSGKGFSFTEYSPYWAHLQGGVREAAARVNMQVLVLDARVSDGWEKADGVLVCDWNDPGVARKMPPGMPIVALMSPVSNMAYAVADDEGAARQAAQHLLELGHRKIAFLHADQSALVFSRLIGYQEALKCAGIKPEAKWVWSMRGQYSYGQSFTSHARRNMKLWLRDGWQKLGCTALICHNDDAAAGAITTLEESGIRVPQDVSVVGFDGTEYCELHHPRLSSVEIPLRAIGAAGVELLLKQIQADVPIIEHSIIKTKFVARDSSCALAYR